jgi:hypothetical protein
MVTIGTDPEFLVYDRDNHGEVWLPYELQGTKEEPFDLGDGFAVHRDGATAELTVPYATSAPLAAEYLSEGIQLLESHLNTLGLGLVDWTSEYDYSHMLDFSDDPYDEAFYEFGCAPDNDAYNGGRERLLKNPRVTFRRKRFAGGHIHVGGTWFVPDFVVAMFLDLTLAKLATYNGGGPDGTRKKWYGKAGTFRTKPYGLEYRTPNNAWCFSPNKRRATYQEVENLVTWLESTRPSQVRDVWESVNWLRLQTIINTGTQLMYSSELDEMRRQAIANGFLEY